MNEVIRTIGRRASCRIYTGQALTSDQIRTIAEAAVTSPSALNLQPWQVIVIQDRQLMDEIEAEGMKMLAQLEDPSMDDRIMERGGKMLYGAPNMIMVSIDGGNITRNTLDCGIVCQTIALAATSMGIGNVICGMARLIFAGNKKDYFRKRLQFPENHIFGGSVLLGVTDQFPKPRQADLSKITYI